MREVLGDESYRELVLLGEADEVELMDDCTETVKAEGDEGEPSISVPSNDRKRSMLGSTELGIFRKTRRVG